MTIHSAFAFLDARLRSHSKRSTFARFAAFPGVFLSLLLLTGAVFAQAPAIPGVTTLKLKSEVLGEERTILVRTPADYEDRQPTLSSALYDGRRRPYWPHRRLRSSFSQETDECLS